MTTLKIIVVFYAAMLALTMVLGVTAHAGSLAPYLGQTHVLHCSPDPLGSGGMVCK